MEKVAIRAYPAPGMILLAFDWGEGSRRKDFLGFAARRTPGFRDPATRRYAPSSWLLNRIDFNGPADPEQPDFPSNEAPIQKFLWWDARIGDEDRAAASAGRNPVFRYEVFPVIGTPGNLQPLAEATGTLDVTLPAEIEHGIGTWFNRAVLSSQGFMRKLRGMGLELDDKPSAEQARELRRWLANGLDAVVPAFLRQAREAVGAIYHLTDELFIVPALDTFSRNHSLALVYDAKKTESADGDRVSPNQPAVDRLKDRVAFFPRDKAAIMHNKYLVSGRGLAGRRPAAGRVVCGSANYTTGALSTQANLMHTFDSSALAGLYFDRFKRLKDNPPLSALTRNARWSSPITVGDAGVRVFFSPEASSQRESIDTIVEAIHRARSSVLFCLFTPTDAELRDACFMAGDNGKMMFGLVNRIARPKTDEAVRADQIAALELYHRSRQGRDVIGAERFRRSDTPEGFDTELMLFPGEAPPPFPPVIIHHKFIVIDGETPQPVIYSGSANMSNNSLHRNDENLLEIRGSRRIAAIYLAEFFRLYEHYRARAAYYRDRETTSSRRRKFKLRPDAGWARKHYSPGTPEYKSRRAMAQE